MVDKKGCSAKNSVSTSRGLASVETYNIEALRVGKSISSFQRCGSKSILPAAVTYAIVRGVLRSAIELELATFSELRSIPWLSNYIDRTFRHETLTDNLTLLLCGNPLSNHISRSACAEIADGKGCSYRSAYSRPSH